MGNSLPGPLAELCLPQEEEMPVEEPAAAPAARNHGCVDNARFVRTAAAMRRRSILQSSAAAVVQEWRTCAGEVNRRLESVFLLLPPGGSSSSKKVLQSFVRVLLTGFSV